MKTNGRIKGLDRYRVTPLAVPADGMPYIKKCSYCKLLKEAESNFNKCDYTKDGYLYICNTCAAVQQKSIAANKNVKHKVKGCCDRHIATEHPEKLPLAPTIVLVEAIESIMTSIILGEECKVSDSDYENMLSIVFMDSPASILIHPSGAFIIELTEYQESGGYECVYYTVRTPAYLAPCIIAIIAHLKDKQPEECEQILTAIAKVKKRFTDSQLAVVQDLQAIYDLKH